MENRTSDVDRESRLLKQCHADAIVVTNPYNVRYLSGFTGGEGFLLIHSRARILVTDSRYTIWAKNECTEYEVRENHMNTAGMLAELTKEFEIEKLAFESKQISVYEFSHYEAELPTIDWVPLSDEVTWLRSIKSDDELLLLKHAESIGDAAFYDVLEYLRPGITEREVAKFLEQSMYSHGAEGLSFDVIAASGLNSAMPHATPSNRKLEKGDFLTMDFGCRYHGYCSDMTRTVVIGKASEKQKHLYQIVLDAQLAVLKQIQAGMRGCEVDKIARAVIDATEYEGCFGHGLGHSVGLEIHEMPSLSRHDDRILQPRMVETVEPGIYVEGFGGVRIEDMVIIEERGCRNLTESDKSLIEI